MVCQVDIVKGASDEVAPEVEASVRVPFCGFLSDRTTLEDWHRIHQIVEDYYAREKLVSEVNAIVGDNPSPASADSQ